MISTILTVENTRQLNEKLDNVQKKLFNAEQSIEAILNSNFSQTEKQEFINFFTENKLNIDNANSVTKGIGKIKQQIDQMPLIIVTTAYVPSVKAIERFSDLISDNIGKKVVLNLNVNPQIIGGAVIEYNGKFGDFSLNAPKIP